MYSASGRAAGLGSLYNRAMTAASPPTVNEQTHRFSGPVPDDGRSRPALRWRVRLLGMALVVTLGLVLAITFRAWLHPDLLLELASTVFCS